MSSEGLLGPFGAIKFHMRFSDLDAARSLGDLAPSIERLLIAPELEYVDAFRVYGICANRQIQAAVAARRALRAIRAFNLTHMNRGRNAYQASHCYSLADRMLSDAPASSRMAVVKSAPTTA
jgi:hypothetical protein